MSSKLHIETKRKEKDDSEEDLPLSPTAEYFNSKAVSMCILAVLEFEIPMDLSRLLPLVQDLFIPINPRFSSLMISDKGKRRWQRVEVNMKDHVKIPSFPKGLPVTEYDMLFEEYLTKIGMEPLPEDKPLWEIHVITYPTSKAAGTAVFKLQHSLGDGYSLMGALLSCLQRADNTSLPLTFPATHREPQADDSKMSMNVINRVSRILYSVYDGMCDFGWSIAKTGWIADDKTSIRSGSQGVGFHPAVRILTVDLSLDKLKQIKTKLDVTINAVLIGIIFLGARLYMKETGEGSRNSKPTLVVVLNTRDVNRYKSIEEMLNADNKLWGNQVAFLHMTLPELTNLNYSNPLDFVSEAQKVITRKKNSPAVYLSGLFLEMVRKYKGSETAAEHIKGALKNSSLGFTSMIGPIEKMALANHPIKGFYYMVTGTHLSIVISAMSYMRTLRMGIGTELGFIDSTKFNLCMEQAFEQIYAAATSST
ncbi:hypothetical protein RND81_03G074700 [Saponaria officinalis]|uniref:Diacylglycerol O-acyltransferase n=1 Tax=Saponaria officinalis TaxID=3572 RepID=A0AAW1M5K7_SAPOF